jgi:hypothetical protein
MALSRTFAAGREQCFQQIEKLTNSHSLKGSESLCKLLRYLSEHSLDHPGMALKEYQIATEVLGRSAAFDPQSDSTVRVQAGRLRMKLADYYAHEGPDDPIVVDLPKGSYSLAFHARTPAIGSAYAIPLPVEAPVLRPKARTSVRGWFVAVVILSILLTASLVSLAILAGRLRQQPVAKETVPAVYQIFWNRFVINPQRTWVVFSNGSFVGRPETGMRYFNPASDSRAFILDHYTGVGEVLAIHQLDRVFARLNRELDVKRGALFTLDDAKNNDVIFVGSPSENLTLRDIPGTRDFIFQRLPSGPRKGDLAIVNVHPQPGEPKTFLPSPANQPTTEDYAMIALLPGLDPVRSVLILAGNSTFGTQAAVEYVCRENSLKELLQRLNVAKSSELKSFEALLRVKIAHGVPVTTELVALRGGNR